MYTLINFVKIYIFVFFIKSYKFCINENFIKNFDVTLIVGVATFFLKKNCRIFALNKIKRIDNYYYIYFNHLL